MELHNLKPAEGSVRKKKRIGRGQGSGRGGTSTRGHKGAKSRSGYKRKTGFQGGQMPLHRLVPKFGFKNINRVEYRGVNLGTLQKLVEKKGLSTIDLQTIVEARLAVKKAKVKILGGGELKAKKLVVKAHAFSKSAKEAIEKLEGTVEVL